MKKQKAKRVWCVVGYVFRRFPVLWKRFLQNFDVERLDVQGNFGMGDPALTGTVYGFIQSLQLFRGKLFRASLVPNFFEAKFEGEVTLVFRFILLRLLWCALRTGVELGWIHRKCWT